MTTRTKTEWRRTLLAARRAVNPAARAVGSYAVARRVESLREFAAASSILVYRAIGAEIDLGDLAARAIAGGRRVCEPVITGSRLCWVAWSGINEAPSADSPAMVPDRPVLALVPGVGFDVRGTRLGRGQGFYDHAVAALRARGDVYVVGVTMAAQVVAWLPRESWDQPVDLVLTERRAVAPLSTAVAEVGLPAADGEARER